MAMDFNNSKEPLELIAPMSLEMEFQLPGVFNSIAICDKGKIAASCAPNGQI